MQDSSVNDPTTKTNQFLLLSRPFRFRKSAATHFNEHCKANTSTSLLLATVSASQLLFSKSRVQCALVYTCTVGPKSSWNHQERKKQIMHIFAFGHSSRDAELLRASTHRASNPVACLTSVLLRCFFFFFFSLVLVFSTTSVLI